MILLLIALVLAVIVWLLTGSAIIAVIVGLVTGFVLLALSASRIRLR